MRDDIMKRALVCIAVILALCSGVFAAGTVTSKGAVRVNPKDGAEMVWITARASLPANLKKQILSSVTWSPDGKYIAFVAIHSSGTYHPKSASIWILPFGKGHLVPTLLHSVKVNKSVGVPVSLFWLSQSRLGWLSVSRIWPSPKGHESDVVGRFKAYSITLKDKTPHLLFKKVLFLEQTRSFHNSAGPDDVYYDLTSQNLILVGQSLHWDNNASTLVAVMYSLRKHRLKIVSLPDKIVGDATIGVFKSTGHLARYFIAGGLDFTKMSLWTTPSLESFRDAKILFNMKDGSFFFPRPSPDGRQILWLEMNSIPQKLVLYDMRSMTRKTIAGVGFDYGYRLNPALGCPFSWSPKGDKVAYVYGSEIRIVAVNQKANMRK